MKFNHVCNKSRGAPRSTVKGVEAIFLGSHLGMLNHEFKFFPLKMGASGKPLPFSGYDFDNTLADTAETYHLASKRLLRSYARNVSRVPKLVEFKRGVHPDFHAWGVPSRFPIEQVWAKLTTIVLAIEVEKPSLLFPGVAEMLRDTAKDRNQFVVTFNSIHSVAEIIKREAGVDVNVVVVAKKKDHVLDALAKHHHYHHGMDVPFYFFSDSYDDVRAAANCVHPVFPVGVRRHEMSNARWERFKREWEDTMIKEGAQGLVGHESLWKATYGEYDFKSSVRNCGRNS